MPQWPGASPGPYSLSNAELMLTSMSLLRLKSVTTTLLRRIRRKSSAVSGRQTWDFAQMICKIYRCRRRGRGFAWHRPSDDGQGDRGLDRPGEALTTRAAKARAAVDKPAVALEAGATAGRHDQCVVSPGFGGAVSFPLAARPDISEKVASERQLQVASADHLEGKARVAVGIADAQEVVQSVVLLPVDVEIGEVMVHQWQAVTRNEVCQLMEHAVAKLFQGHSSSLRRDIDAVRVQPLPLSNPLRHWIERKIKSACEGNHQ